MGSGRVPRVVAGVVLLVGFAATACGSDRATEASGDGELRIVTTVSPLTNIVANIAGDAATIVGVVPEGTNSHTFEPPPSVAETMATADLIFVNGLKLEDPTLELAEQHKREDAEIVELGDRVLPEGDYIFDFSFPKDEGKPNPHLWTDPTYAKRYAAVVKAELSRADERQAPTYARNYDAFVQKIDALDAALRAASASLPEERRKLLTYHDAYAYFARTYGWKVIGAIQVSSFDDPTAKELTALIGQVRREQVAAIFGSEVFPSPVLERIGDEAGVRYVDELRDDDLPGKPGDPDHTWLALLRFDYTTIVEALGGDASALKALDVTNVTTDNARYPQ